MEIDVIYNMDCLEGMKTLPDGSIDMILCDLPYGTTRNKWDSIIPFDALWKQYKRIIKDQGAVVLFGDGLFTAKLILSNVEMWRYNLIWDKQKGCDFLNANIKPMKSHEDICVFYKKSPFIINSIGFPSRTKGRYQARLLPVTGIHTNGLQNQPMEEETRFPFCLFRKIQICGFILHKSLFPCWNT